MEEPDEGGKTKVSVPGTTATPTKTTPTATTPQKPKAKKGRSKKKAEKRQRQSGKKGNVRSSRSHESFISSSTRVSERQEDVFLRAGWGDDEGEVCLLESETEFITTGGVDGISVILRPAAASASDSKVPGTVGSGASSQMQGLTDMNEKKELGAVALSLLRVEFEEAKLRMEAAIKGRWEGLGGVIGDLDDAFLLDAISYGLLPDSDFFPDFDYFNEESVCGKGREPKPGESLMNKNAKKKRDAKQDKLKRTSESTLDLTDTESEMEMSTLARESAACTKPVRDSYKTCLAKQKKRIEDRIRKAVECRTAMGAYIVPPGEQPLAKTFADAGPGPAAYSPNINSVKAGPLGVFLARRWTNSIYDTPGPGPGAYFPHCNKCTGEMLNLHFAERFEKSETIGPGPGQYDTLKNTAAGKDKPHAIILSRRPADKVGCGGSRYVNIFGFNQFGKYNSPKPVIMSRHEPIDKSDRGPGAYDPSAVKDTRVGILIKSRIPALSELQDSPNFVTLPPLIGRGPGVSLGIRKFPTLQADSPGPIYQLPSGPPKPVTMTFKPFPMPGRDADPSPIHYGTVPGEQNIKMTKPKGANPLICGSHNLNYGKGNTPGPNKYKIRDCKCLRGITMVGKYKTKSEQTGPGPADYTIGNYHYAIPPRPVFQHKWHDSTPKIPPKCVWIPNAPQPENPLDPCTSLMKDPKSYYKIPGGLMSARWSEKAEEEVSGPGFYDLFGFTNKGKYSKIPISLKSRQSPFVYTHMSKTAEVPNRTSCDITQRLSK